MDRNKLVIIGAQCVVVMVLGALVALGHDSAITDGLLVVCGSLAGTGVLNTVRVIRSKPSD